MSRNPHRAGWAMVLTGMLGSAAAAADCDGIEMARYEPLPGGRLELVETSCHVGSELFLPWIDTGLPIGTPARAARSSATRFDSRDLDAPRAVILDDVPPTIPKADE